MSDFLKLDAIFAAPDVNESDVDVPEWGGKVRVQGLTKAQQLNIRKKAVRGTKIDDTVMEGLMLVNGVVEPQFQEHHIPDLFAKQSGPIDRVLAKIMELSGMNEDDMKGAEDDLKS